MKKTYWKVDKYFYEGVYEQLFPQGHQEKLLFYHRTLTSYFQAFSKAGFILEDLLEPKPSEETLEKYPSFKEGLRSCNFIVFKLKKSMKQWTTVNDIFNGGLSVFCAAFQK